MKRLWASPWLPVAAAVAALAPFAGKAFNVDDPLFLWTARQIAGDPVRFFDFSVNWYGWDMPMAEVLKNPPGVSYYLALVGSVVGWGEVAIHLALAVPAALVAWGTHALARELSGDPVVAGLATVATPAFVVCGTNVMADMSMLAGWLWALVLWVRGIDTKRTGLLFAAGIVAAAALLTKYFALALIGLFAVYAWRAGGRRFGGWVVPATLPAVALLLHEWWTAAAYDVALFSDAASYATRFSASGLLSQLLTGLSFAGGSAAIVLFFSPLVWSRRALAVLAGVIVTLLVVAVLQGRLAGAPLRLGSGLRWGMLLQLGLLMFGGLALIGLAVDDFRRSRDAASLLLFVWVAGTFVFACFVNWSINVRSMLPLVPAGGVLLARHAASGKGARWPLAPGLLLALLVGASDHAWAESARDAANRIHSDWRDKGVRVWFQGHWGFQWYMQEHGHRPFDIQAPQVERGDVIVLPTNNTNVRRLDPRLVSELPPLEVRTHGWLSTMNLDLGAGCYSHLSAPLPFAFGPAGTERYVLLRAEQPIRGRPVRPSR